MPYFQIGNVAEALWTLVISVHVFNLLFLRNPTTKKFVPIAVTVGVWGLVGTICICSPAVLEKPKFGPYFGPSGYWCWITEEYSGSRIGAVYFWVRF